jgi:ferrous iron transport protein A
VRIDGEPALAQRLMELGLIEGAEIEVIGVAPFGDPIQVAFERTRLAIRRGEARAVLLTE